MIVYTSTRSSVALGSILLSLTFAQGASSVLTVAVWFDSSNNGWWHRNIQYHPHRSQCQKVSREQEGVELIDVTLDATTTTTLGGMGSDTKH
jgi:hypothetical protein